MLWKKFGLLVPDGMNNILFMHSAGFEPDVKTLQGSDMTRHPVVKKCANPALQRGRDISWYN